MMIRESSKQATGLTGGSSRLYYSMYTKHMIPNFFQMYRFKLTL